MAQILRNNILGTADDKTAARKRYGVVCDPADWPTHGIQPKQFLADQAEPRESARITEFKVIAQQGRSGVLYSRSR